MTRDLIAEIAKKYIHFNYPEWGSMDGVDVKVLESNDLLSEIDREFLMPSELLNYRWWRVYFKVFDDDPKLGIRGECPIVYIEKSSMRAVRALRG